MLIMGAIIGFATTSVLKSPDTEAYIMPLADDFVSLQPQIESIAPAALSKEEVAGIIFMREEEKLARDVYTTLYEAWGLPIFANIAQSEQTHTEAVRTLLDKYYISDPVTDDTVGVFVDNTFAELYRDLTERGSKSIDEALQVGALIEDLDIKDLAVYMSATDNQDITLVYQNLARGSRNHLRAFTKQIESRGDTYTPQYISNETYAEIIQTDREKGQGGAGRGWGAR